MDQLMTAKQAAAILNVPVRWLYNARYQGQGPAAVRVGKYLRYRPADLEEYLDSRADSPAPAA